MLQRFLRLPLSSSVLGPGWDELSLGNIRSIRLPIHDSDGVTCFTVCFLNVLPGDRAQAWKREYCENLSFGLLCTCPSYARGSPCRCVIPDEGILTVLNTTNQMFGKPTNIGACAAEPQRCPVSPQNEPQWRTTRRTKTH